MFVAIQLNTEGNPGSQDSTNRGGLLTIFGPRVGAY